MKKIHLVCNAHLDPVWLWQRSEGMAEAMATFRIAADFCEKYDGFVFNHNEAVLYEWILEHDAELFQRIKNLVKQGKWRIMGGWYLQPDMLMPSGESIIRQIKVGNDFFMKHFGYVPKTAIGFDAFGHSRGVVQILKKCGYENYGFWRFNGDNNHGPLIWEGFDGSRVYAHRLYGCYNTPKGEAIERIKKYIQEMPDGETHVLTWGIGNHGGGPSEKDLCDIHEFAKESSVVLEHSDFDRYFDEADKGKFPVISSSLTHCMIGCYTTMARIKQGHRNLENKIALCEKMLWQSGISYDKKELLEAEKALLFTEFHDVLPGTAIKKVEEDSLRLLGYGGEIVDRLTTKAFFDLCKGQPKAREGEIPVFVYNPHPYPIEGIFEAEFQMAEQNDPTNGIYDVRMMDEKGNEVLCQLEQEDSAHGKDWRKKVAFHGKLNPMGMTRFQAICQLDKEYQKIKPYLETEEHIVLKNDRLMVKINRKTGLVERYCVDGKDVLKRIVLKAYRDNEDPWGMTVDGFYDLLGTFEPTGYVKVIENGKVRTRIQAEFRYDKSYAYLTYTFSKFSKTMDVDVKILMNNENIMVKLSMETTCDKDATAYVQTMFGTEEAHKEGKECVFQKWCGVKDDVQSVCILNDGTYGGSFLDNQIELSLLRTPVYSAHPIMSVKFELNDRIYNHIDMGEREFRFRICINEENVDYEAELFNQKPYILSFFPSGNGEKEVRNYVLDNKNVLLTMVREEEKGTLFRVFNTSDSVQGCKIGKYELILSPFEVKTLFDNQGKLSERNMLGNELKKTGGI